MTEPGSISRGMKSATATASSLYTTSARMRTARVFSCTLTVSAATSTIAALRPLS